jgi:hypothetical protein
VLVEVVEDAPGIDGGTMRPQESRRLVETAEGRTWSSGIQSGRKT